MKDEFTYYTVYWVLEKEIKAIDERYLEFIEEV